MQQYLGTKLIEARPLTRASYNALRGWTLPEGEDGDDEGYLVEYMDGGKPNHEDYAGYISWSPKAQFEAAYRPTDGMSFGLAVEALKRGKKVARSGWNGKGTFVFLVNGSTFKVNRPPLLGSAPFIALYAADHRLVPWHASQTDILAVDWSIL